MMKRSLVAVLAAVVAMPAMPALSGDRALFHQNEMREAPAVMGGSAPIDKALPQIVPSPYRVYLDDTVPATLFLVWKQGDNWMEVLNRALAPVGLVARPDWAKNSITIGWSQQPAAAAPVAAAPEAPIRISTQRSASGMSGSFEVASPVSAPESASRKPSAKVAPAREEVEAEVIVAGHKGRLPAPGEMWRLMKAAVAGKQIILTGYSGVRDEKRRVLLANSYANTLRDKLLAIGFPASGTVVNVRETYGSAGDRPRVEIAVMSEEGL